MVKIPQMKLSRLPKISLPFSPSRVWQRVKTRCLQLVPRPVRQAVFGGAIAALLVTGFAYYLVTTLASPIYLPDPGAYDLPQTRALGLVVDGEGQSTQTLMLNLSGARIDKIDILNIDIGKATGLTYALQVQSLGGGTLPATRIYAETFTLDGLHCSTLTIQNSEVNNLVVTNNEADGMSLSYTLGTPSDIDLGSTRGQSVIPQITGSATARATYDRIVIDGGANSADVRDIILTGLQATGAPCIIENVTVGTFTITNSVIGSGNGINTADLIIASSVTVKNFTITGNTEREINVR